MIKTQDATKPFTALSRSRREGDDVRRQGRLIADALVELYTDCVAMNVSKVDSKLKHPLISDNREDICESSLRKDDRR